MPKNKHAKDEEFFKETIRHQEKQIRQLRQRIKQLERFPKEKIEIKKTRIKEDLCNSCGKGTLKEMEFGPRKFLICDLCRERTKVK